MQKIIPHLWFDTQAQEATNWYISLFENSGIDRITQLYDTPSGDAQIIDFHLAGFMFSSMSAGPYFKINGSISFMVACENAFEVDRLYDAFSESGKVIIPLESYPFSPRYAYVQDRFGVSWQLIQVENMLEHPRIRPVLLFSGSVCGKADEAMAYYMKVFSDSKMGYVQHYEDGETTDPRGKISYGELTLLGTPLIFMDNDVVSDESDTFNEAISLIINCKHQGEMDDYWEQLSHDLDAEQCGWLKDQFGLSWQITTEELSIDMANASEEEMRRMTDALLPMKKLDMHIIKAAKKGLQTPDPLVVTTTVSSNVSKVWHYFTEPTHITKWYFASSDWHAPYASNDLYPGGSFTTRMEARDGSFGFDFSGTYDYVEQEHYIAYTLEDDRKVFIRFTSFGDTTRIIQTFDADTTNSKELQQSGWQAILDNFNHYVQEATL